MEEGAPEVLALALPAEDAAIPKFLEHVWAFDHVLITEEDRNRNVYYAQAQDFGRELRRAQSMQAFLETLDLRVRLEPLTPERVARVAQLTQRTNQFNVTTIRRGEAEVMALVGNAEMECLTVAVSDRFGDYGLTGAVIFQATREAIEVETFLLSCRVLGRGVEHRVMAHLADEALRRGLGVIRVQFRPSARNEPARQFLLSMGADLEKDGGGHSFRVGELSGLMWKPGPVEVAAPAPGSSTKKSSKRKRPDYGRIAREFASAEQILMAVRGGITGPASSGEGLSDTEARLAAIWSDLLRRSDISPSSNFFDVGGHSLLVVLLLVRVRESFGVELAIDDVYAPDLTLRDLADKIEALQLGDPEEYEALLKEIEGLSDEEVARLLAEEDPGSSRP